MRGRKIDNKSFLTWIFADSQTDRTHSEIVMERRCIKWPIQIPLLAFWFNKLLHIFRVLSSGQQIFALFVCQVNARNKGIETEPKSIAKIRDKFLSGWYCSSNSKECDSWIVLVTQVWFSVVGLSQLAAGDVAGENPLLYMKIIRDLHPPPPIAFLTNMNKWTSHSRTTTHGIESITNFFLSEKHPLPAMTIFSWVSIWNNPRWNGRIFRTRRQLLINLRRTKWAFMINLQTVLTNLSFGATNQKLKKLFVVLFPIDFYTFS